MVAATFQPLSRKYTAVARPIPVDAPVMNTVEAMGSMVLSFAGRNQLSEQPPKLILAVGLPGSGKSTYLAQIGAHPISTDVIRELLADDATDQTIHDRVFASVRYLARHRIALARPVTYIDATSLTRKDRAQWIGFARETGCTPEALFFDTPLTLCLERNRNRSRQVPEMVIVEMAGKLSPPTLDEGFSRVAVVHP
jgi:predicted kinase